MAKAMDPGTIVAYAMNGQPIPAAHGSPLRLVVPGWEGAYAVKWLNKITLATAEHDGFWVATGYRYPTKRVAPGAAVDAKDLAPLTGLVVKSLITRPLDGAVVPPGPVHGGRLRLGRRDRHRARRRLGGRRAPPGSRRSSPANPNGSRGGASSTRSTATRQDTHTILSRATDAKGVTQPIVPQWNPSGYLWNAPDQVRIEVKG